MHLLPPSLLTLLACVCWPLLPQGHAAPASKPTASTHFASLSAAVTYAQGLGSSREGSAYKSRFLRAIGPTFRDAMQACTAEAKPPFTFEMVFVVAADGRVTDVLHTPKQPVAACVARRLRGFQLPAPPRPEWLVAVDMTVRP